MGHRLFGYLGWKQHVWTDTCSLEHISCCEGNKTDTDVNFGEGSGNVWNFHFRGYNPGSLGDGSPVAVGSRDEAPVRGLEDEVPRS